MPMLEPLSRSSRPFFFRDAYGLMLGKHASVWVLLGLALGLARAFLAPQTPMSRQGRRSHEGLVRMLSQTKDTSWKQALL
jgi:hypothetical protein